MIFARYNVGKVIRWLPFSINSQLHTLSLPSCVY